MTVGVLLAAGLVGSDRSRAVPAGSNGPKVAFTSDRGGDMEIFVLQPRPQRVTNPDGSVVLGTWIGADVQPLTGDPGDDTSPSWSPPGEGSRIAFDSNRAGDYDIYVMNEDGSSVTQLTSGSGQDTDPSWSPEALFDGVLGSQIAFLRSGDIYVIRPDGTGQTRLTRTPARDSAPTWSPDGTRIAFVRGGDVWVMNRDGSGAARLARTGAPEADPSWFRFSNPSPEERIAFTRRVGRNYEVISRRLEGGEENLTASVSEDARPSWSPDGQQVLFESNRDGNYELYVMNANGSGQTRLTIDPADDLDADWQIRPTGVTDFWVKPNPSGGNPKRRTCTRVGNDGANRLKGGPGRDVLCGVGGNDRLLGRGGDDYLVGGSGRDLINGGRGRDALHARDGGRDKVRGGRGSDRARIDQGRDRVRGVESRE